jgi:hypothetical protein
MLLFYSDQSRLLLIDQALNSRLLNLVSAANAHINPDNLAQRIKTVAFALDCNERRLCSSTVLPLTMLNCLLETATIDECSRAFALVEDYGEHWKKVAGDVVDCIRICISVQKQSTACVQRPTAAIVAHRRHGHVRPYSGVCRARSAFGRTVRIEYCRRVQ